MNAKPTTSCTVVSFGPLETGRNHLRLIQGSEELTLPVRKAKEIHRAFILATWIRSYIPVLRKRFGLADPDVLSQEEAKQAETLWEQTQIVGSEDDDFTVHAWVCGSPGRLDYVYVPPELRRKGLAGALIKHVCGHTYEYGRPWPFKGNPNGGRYNPYIIGRN